MHIFAWQYIVWWLDLEAKELERTGLRVTPNTHPVYLDPDVLKLYTLDFDSAVHPEVVIYEAFMAQECSFFSVL